MARRTSQGIAGATLLVAVLLLAGCDWTQFRYGPDHTGFSPFETTVGPANVSELRLRWSQRGGSLQAINASPTIANGMLYAASDRLYALDASNGSARWSVAGIGFARSSPAVANGVVYVSGDKLYALDATTGARRWTAAAATGFSSPTVANSVVYVSGDHKDHAFDAATGVRLWSAAGATGTSPPTVANGVVYVGGQNEVYALNAATGVRLWTAATPGGNSSPAVAGGVIYRSSVNGLFALNAVTGARLWTAKAGGEFGAPAVASGVVYVSGDKLYAFNASTGAQVWSVYTPYLPGPPTVANGVVYVSADKLYAFSTATGAQLWTAPASAEHLVMANGVVYVAGNGLAAYSLPAAEPRLVISPAFPDEHLFGDPASATRTYTITNNGSISTSAITNSLAGSNATDFRLVSDGCTGISLAGGASCTVDVSFAPTGPGPRTGWLTSTATAGGTVKALLTGNAQPLTISPSWAAFPDVFAGATTTAAFTVTNLSSGPVGPIADSITPASGFTIAGDACAGKIVAARASCTISVKFAPTFSLDYSGTLVAQAPGFQAEAVVQGRGISRLAIAPSAKDFGPVPVGATTSVTFTVTNISPSPAGPISSAIEHVWQSSALSVTSDACVGRTLAANSSCAVVVTFAPTSTGFVFGRLTSVAPLAGSATVSLIGAGT